MIIDESVLVKKTGVNVESGWTYFVDNKGNISRLKEIASMGVKKNKPELVRKCRVVKRDGYIYFVDKRGDIRKVDIAKKPKFIRKMIKNSIDKKVPEKKSKKKNKISNKSLRKNK